MYTLILEDSASESLNRLDKVILARITKRLQWLADNASAIKHEALTGQWSGRCRIRAGDYRIIYRLDHENLLVIVEVIGHRRGVYDE